MGFKIKKEKVQQVGVKKGSKNKRVITGLVAFIVAITLVNILATFKLKEEVEIVQLKAGIPAEGVITQDNIEKGTMVKAEFEKQGVITLADGSKKRAIVLWEDRQKLANSYASYYIRGKTPIYWDSISREIPKKYSYLYKMDGELAYLEISADTFGEMLVPGDRINIRATYQEQVFTLPTEKEFMMQQQMGIQAQTSVQRNIKLFNNVAVLDILNAKGESIFDLYYQILSLPKAQQREIVNSPEFQDQVKPSKILLNVTPEEADNYMNIKNKGPKYMMTLLPRTSSNLISEALSELQTGFTRQKN